MLLLFKLFLYTDKKKRIDSTIRPKELHASIVYLASDELEGRAAGTKGGELTSQYISDMFQRYRINPISSAGYKQSFEMIATKYSKTSTITIGTQELNWAYDFIIRNGSTSTISGKVKTLNSFEDIYAVDVQGVIVAAP